MLSMKAFGGFLGRRPYFGRRWPSYRSTPTYLLQGLHRLPGPAGRAGRPERPPAFAGELPAESVRLIAGELLKRGIQLCSTTPVTAHRQMLLEECFVVAFLFRCILWRRTTRPHQALH